MGARNAIFALEDLRKNSPDTKKNRGASLMGVFVAEYLSQSPFFTAVQGAIDAVTVHALIFENKSNVSDPDFALLEAFSDALQVDVQDLLNRSDNREQALDGYSEALMNVAQRANERRKELQSLSADLSTQSKINKKELTAAQKALKTAIDSKEFDGAGEVQDLVLEKKKMQAELDTKIANTNQVIKVLDANLTFFGEKLLAMQRNREALIAGITIIDIPGVEELKLIQRDKRRNNTSLDELLK